MTYQRRDGMGYRVYDSRFKWFMQSGYAFALGCLLAIVVIVALIVGGLAAVAEKNCNSQVDRLNSPRVVDGDFDFWANTCYATLTDGRVIPLGNHRTNEREDVIK